MSPPASERTHGESARNERISNDALRDLRLEPTSVRKDARRKRENERISNDALRDLRLEPTGV